MVAHPHTQRNSQKASAPSLWSYLGTTAVIFAITVASAATLDLLPEASGSTVAATPALVAAPAPAPVVALPERIMIPSLDKELPVANPVSTSVAVLDRALLSGTVRYPTSAKLGEDGNVIIFGHSSYLPIVRNDMFKAFNGIEDLEQGDEIVVEAGGIAYVYAVESVKQANAAEDMIPLTVDGKKLTLATCDSFGTPQDRFIVTAGFVGTRAL